MTEEKILSRVRKMLALANDSAATEGERDNALRMAHNLLTKHNLDMEDVSQAARDADDPRGVYSMDGWGIPWCRSIRNIIAKLFMCKYVSCKINTTKYRHDFIGRESNATTAMYMADWIVLGLLREADKRYEHRLTAAGRSFGEGAAAKLWDRVKEMQREAQDVVKTAGSALVLLDLAKQEDDFNQSFMDGWYANLKTGKSRNSKVDPRAYNAGKDHASSISLNTQVTNTKKTLRIS